MDEFDKLESAYHEIMLQDKKEQGDKIGQFRTKQS